VLRIAAKSLPRGIYDKVAPMKRVNNSKGPDLTRRRFVANVGKGLISLGIVPDPGKPQTQEALQQLGAEERATLAAVGETLLPGAADAGIVRYVQTQLASKEPLLFVRYLDYPEGLVPFYRRGLRALEELSERRYGQGFTNLASEQRGALARDLSQGTPADWTGPPGPLFYLALRNDAVDVYYGTEQGFRKLGIPYLALIAPQKPW
jgi:Gluconate 2-dehydrogenase subunit 3